MQVCPVLNELTQSKRNTLSLIIWGIFPFLVFPQKNFNEFDTYIFGETHYFIINTEVKYEMIEKLHLKNDVNDFVFEGSAIYVALIDHYVRTGKEHFLHGLEKIFLSTKPYFKGEPKFPTDYYKRLRSLYIESKNKFRIHSIDNERLFTVSGLEHFLIEYPNDSILKSLLSNILELRLDSIPIDRPLVIKDKNWLNLIKKNKDKAQTYYTNNIQNNFFKASLIRNLYLNEAIPNRTDRNMAKNFANLKKSAGFTNCMLWFGSLHAQNKGGWLANKVKEQGNNVVSILLLYKGCYNRFFDKKVISEQLSHIIERDIPKTHTDFIESSKFNKLKKYDYVKILDCK